MHPSPTVASDTRALVLQRLPFFLHENTLARLKVSMQWLSSPNHFRVTARRKLELTKRIQIDTGTKKVTGIQRSAIAEYFAEFETIHLWISVESDLDLYEYAKGRDRELESLI